MLQEIFIINVLSISTIYFLFSNSNLHNLHKKAPSSSNDKFSKSCFLTQKCNYWFIFQPIETKISGNICIDVTNKLMVGFFNTYPTRNDTIKNH